MTIERFIKKFNHMQWSIITLIVGCVLAGVVIYFFNCMLLTIMK